jgi:hypothetical protein
VVSYTALRETDNFKCCVTWRQLALPTPRKAPNLSHQEGRPISIVSAVYRSVELMAPHASPLR